MTTQTQRTEAQGQMGALAVATLRHPQGCRTYLLSDPQSRQAMAVDVHLDFVDEVASRVQQNGWTLVWVVDTHTHADHPSGSGPLAARVGCTRAAHEKAQHQGISRQLRDGDTLDLGDQTIAVRHAPGHTPDHVVLVTDGAVFAGDTLLIGGVARTDFLGGDAGQLFDSLHRVFDELPDDTVLFPGHDYEGRERSTLGEQRRSNPWLQLKDRAEFSRQLAANPPPRPATMDDLLRLNRQGVEIPAVIAADEAVRFVQAGGGTSVIDVRTGLEFDGERIEGSRLIPLDQIAQRADEVRATPAPRLLLCRTGNRAALAQQALGKLHVQGLRVVAGGIEAFRGAGGATQCNRAVISLERQVRIAAGSLVLIGAVLGWLVHPAFVGLSMFVGAGLVFSGLTDWCGMGLLLAKAPWNRGSASPCAAPASSCAAAAPAACAARPPAPGGTQPKA